ncbi:MAG: dihydropteroate synthase [Gammaproteobacteria bacterium]|nr:dihydropteroate synthase [Gammaproteobacteria bacterium]
MEIYLGLGSNVGDRCENLRRSIELLQKKGLKIVRISPVVESPALLPKYAPAAWNLPFLNLAIECDAECSPQQLREWITEIQNKLGRTDSSHWSPRPIDIDILLWGRETIATTDLTTPHPQLLKRGFVLTPLVALRPRLTVPGLGPKTMLEWSGELPHHIPLWMGIVNITPDSFSDGGRHVAWRSIEPHVDAMVQAGVHIIDVGAESTRPGATPVGPGDEWLRLEPILEHLVDKYKAPLISTLLSVDTYHPEVAAKALDAGVDIINDVSGLTSPAMIDLARSSDKEWIAMHQLTLPADRGVTLPPDRDPCEEVERWLLEQIEVWDKANLDLNKIIFDPGIGFGKDALQSLELLRHASRFRKHGLRVLIGHSRKSFMKSFSSLEEHDKDLATIGASLKLCEQGVDIIRVHNVPAHLSAYRGWSHLIAEPDQPDHHTSGKVQ